MKNIKDINKQNEQELRISPAKKYNTPKYPVYTEVRANPVLLKKLPSRWQKNAAVIACIGLMGTYALAGCAAPQDNAAVPPYPPYYADGGSGGIITEQYTREADRELDLVIRTHHGGGGAGPFYVVYLTEQEALSIIRAQAEAAGLRFNAAPPDYTVDALSMLRGIEIGIDLFDGEKGVALALIDGADNYDTLRWVDTGSVLREAAREFEKQDENIHAGVFMSYGQWISWDWHLQLSESGLAPSPPPMTDEEKTEAGKAAEEQLRAQVREFITTLQRHGITEITEPEVDDLESDAASD
jgi:hypothetical protein